MSRDPIRVMPAAQRPSRASPHAEPGALQSPTIPRVANRVPWFRIALGSVAIVTGLVHLARDSGVGRPDETAASSMAAPTASAGLPQPVAPPRPVFALETPDHEAALHDAEAHRTVVGEREEVLRYGAFDQPAAYFHLHADARQEIQPASTGFFIETARRASDAGLGVTRSAQPLLVRTKFGAAETAETVLAGAADRTCLAFRLHRTDVGLRLAGWLCGGPSQPAEPAQLACAIDRLVVDSASGGAALTALFAEAERGREPACGKPAAMAKTDPQTAPFTAARTGSVNRRRREKTSVVRSASR